MEDETQDVETAEKATPERVPGEPLDLIPNLRGQIEALELADIQAADEQPSCVTAVREQVLSELDHDRNSIWNNIVSNPEMGRRDPYWREVREAATERTEDSGAGLITDLNTVALSCATPEDVEEARETLGLPPRPASETYMQ